MLFLLFFTILTFSSIVNSEPEANFEDTRCRCICPSTWKFVDGDKNQTDKPENHKRRYYTKTNVEPSSCKPINIVKEQVEQIIDDAHIDAFLANCDCRYESRNTVLLKVVVIFVICVIAVLTGYMVFLMCLDPMLRKKRLSISYQQHNDEMEDNIFAAATSEDDSAASASIDPHGTTRARTSSSSSPDWFEFLNEFQAFSDVLGRVEAEQSRWMRKVEEQRKNIFEDHTMLN